MLQLSVIDHVYIAPGADLGILRGGGGGGGGGGSGPEFFEGGFLPPVIVLGVRSVVNNAPQ